MQHIENYAGAINKIGEFVKKLDCKIPMIVCDKSFSMLNLQKTFDNLQKPCVYFDGFSSNPLYEDVSNGIILFNKNKCDSIIAVGGGSAIDVAKCIKLFCKTNCTENYLFQPYTGNDVKLIAVPTTAGTGSESTRFAVVYYNGIKQSVTHDSIVPDVAILDCNLLKTLPVYQKKCTMLDALCQGIESYWSVNSTAESRDFARKAVLGIVGSYKRYIDDSDTATDSEITTAANYAGRAINITQTTAPHAMSYKLTSMYKIPHGHAVAICLPKVWAYMLDNTDKCIDVRGENYLTKVFREIAGCFGVDSAREAIKKFEALLNELGIAAPSFKNGDIDVLAECINPTRLKNNPVSLDSDAIRFIYKKISEGELK